MWSDPIYHYKRRFGNVVEDGSFLGYGRIFGSVVEDGKPKANTPVYLVALGPNGTPFTTPIGHTVTDSEGNFNFVGVSPDYSDYAVIVIDNTEPYKIAKICDKLTPVEDLSLANWFAQSCLYGPHHRVFIGNLFDAYNVRARCSTSLGGHIRILYDGRYIPIAAQLFTQDRLPYPRINSIFYELEHDYLPPSDRSIPLLAQGAPTVHTLTQSDLTQQSFECFINVDAFSSSEAIEQTIVWDIISRTYAVTPIINFTSSPDFSFCRFTVKFLYDAVSNKPIVRLVVRPTYAEYPNIFDAPGTYFDFDLSGYSGYIHLMLVIDVSTSIKLFVNGSLVGSQPTTITFDTIDASVTRNRVLPYSAARVSDLIFYAVYPYALTDAQVSDLYDKINLRASYVLSKYHQTALSYHPLRYYKLDDAVTDLSSGSCRMLLTYGDDKSKAHLVPTTTNASDYLFSEPSPVAGSASVRLFGSSNSYLMASEGTPLSFGSENTLSLTCWIKLANFPTTLAHIINCVDNIEFLVAPDGSLSIRVHESNNIRSLNEYPLNTTLNVNTWYFVTCVISLYRHAELRYIRLYLGTDTDQPTLQAEVDPATIFTPSTFSSTGLLGFIRNWPEQLYVGKNFDGWISELGWFPSALSETQILKLWEARKG